MHFLRVNWAVAAAVLLLSQAIAPAQDVELTDDYDQSGYPVVDQSLAQEYAPEAPVEDQVCPACNGAGCELCGGTATPDTCAYPAGGAYPASRPYTDPCPRIGWYGYGGVDSFRGIADGTHQNNNGFTSGLNGAVPVPWLSTYGVGAQFGASYGVYDVNGQSVPAPGSSQPQQQVFITTGFFRRADAQIPISFGFVHDWMINSAYGTFANAPTLGQWRVQLGWAVSAWNEIGLWGSYRDLSSTKLISVNGVPLFQTYQPIGQLNVFWHHKWVQLGGDSWMYVGLPDRSRLNQDPTNTNPAGAGGSLGEFILGTNWLLPLNDCLSVYANAAYMKPSAHSGVTTNGAVAAAQEFWDVSV
ncbi:MAG TPA: DUF6666 family protein, partial [Pirellulales bacterium]|nr:DUF6666 family protein [Pirellulales bacterium]